MGIYCKPNKEKLWTDFGRNIKLGHPTKKGVITTLFRGLGLLIETYDEYAQTISDLIKVCEADLENKKSP
jgi:hypothetical protein